MEMRKALYYWIQIIVVAALVATGALAGEPSQPETVVVQTTDPAPQSQKGDGTPILAGTVDTGKEVWFEYGLSAAYGRAVPSPTLFVSCADTQKKAPLSVTFEVRINPGPLPYTYEYDFGDGTRVITKDADQQRHTYRNPGRYTATITLTDAGGATAQRITHVDVTAASRPRFLLFGLILGAVAIAFFIFIGFMKMCLHANL